MAATTVSLLTMELVEPAISSSQDDDCSLASLVLIANEAHSQFDAAMTVRSLTDINHSIVLFCVIPGSCVCGTVLRNARNCPCVRIGEVTPRRG